jgi:hypothetical protein
MDATSSTAPTTRKTEEEIKEFQDLLRKRLVRPSKLELWVMTADGRRKGATRRVAPPCYVPLQGFCPTEAVH